MPLDEIIDRAARYSLMGIPVPPADVARLVAELRSMREQREEMRRLCRWADGCAPQNEFVGQVGRVPTGMIREALHLT